MQKGASYNAPFRSVIDGLLHPSLQENQTEERKHRIFLALHLLLGVIALAALPIYLLMVSSPTPLEALAPLWMLAPLFPVVLLSRQGKLETAILLSATLAAGLVAWMALLTGGLKSFHLIWLAIIPLEISLAGYRSLQAKSFALAASAFVAVAVMSFLQPEGALAGSIGFAQALGYVSLLGAVLYAGSLVLRLDAMQKERVKVAQYGERHYRQITEAVTDMITCHDAKGDVTYASGAARDLLNLEADSLSGAGLFQQIHIPDRPAYLQALSDAMNNTAEEPAAILVEIRLLKQAVADDRHAGGTLIWAEMKCAPKRNSAGDVIGAVTTTRDISERKAHQDELERARNEAEAASSAKTRFLANVTHELRTPLNTIIGFSELLTNPQVMEDQPERKIEYAELIHKGGHHLLSLVNALLDMSRIESGNFEVHPQHFDMRELVEDCCKMMQAGADKKGIALYVEMADSIPDMNADPRACRQILLNLMSNAIKFSHDNSQVAVSLAWDKDAKGSCPRSHVRISVTDQGIGIKSDDIPRLTMPFVQADSSYQRRYEGAGIGLSIVKGLAELQGGDLKIESVEGKGSTFSIILPLDMENPAMLETNSVVSLNVKSGEVHEAGEAHQIREARIAMTRGKAEKSKINVA
ncbi:MAG: PAS domain-containing sensor histidine kinase [Cohaesibacter sp.]|nr:PAS domain-containing sensor histidine kinase [Cohaesibacter sp.]